jgi:hypothetical protein
MPARLIQIEGSAPWQGRCACGWRGDPAGTRDDARLQSERHRRQVHYRAAVDADRQRRHRLNAAPPC